MDRQIIFRGKDFQGVWHYGYLFQGQTKSNEKYKYSVILKQMRFGVDDRLPEDLPLAFYKDEVFVVDPNTVGQCTGLKDKNKKDIYKGDIVRWSRNNRLYLVKFTLGMFYASIDEFEKNIRGGFPLHAMTDNEEDGYRCEVIGNIHDNSELLKQE